MLKLKLRREHVHEVLLNSMFISNEHGVHEVVVVEGMPAAFNEKMSKWLRLATELDGDLHDVDDLCDSAVWQKEEAEFIEES